MNDERQHITPRTYDYPVVERFSWSAILAGVFITLGIFISFLTLGLSLGLAVMDFEDGISLTATTWFSSIWIVLSFLSALAVATYCTARLSSRGSYISGVLNGLTVWAVASVFLFYGATKSSAKIIASTGQMVTEQLKGVTEPLTSNLLGSSPLEDVNLDYFKEVYKDVEAPELKRSVQFELRKLTREAQSTARKILKNPNQAKSSLSQLKATAQGSYASIRDEYGKERIAEIIARNSDLSQSEVAKAAGQWETKLNNVGAELESFFSKVESEVVDAADSAKNSVATTSFLMFLFLGLGFIVSFFSSSIAAKRI